MALPWVASAGEARNGDRGRMPADATGCCAGRASGNRAPPSSCRWLPACRRGGAALVTPVRRRRRRAPARASRAPSSRRARARSCACAPTSIDRLVNEAGEVAIARARVEGELRALKANLLELTNSVIRLRAQVREIEIQAESQIQSQMQHAGSSTAISIRWSSTATRASRS